MPRRKRQPRHGAWRCQSQRWHGRLRQARRTRSTSAGQRRRWRRRGRECRCGGRGGTPSCMRQRAERARVGKACRGAGLEGRSGVGRAVRVEGRADAHAGPDAGAHRDGGRDSGASLLAALLVLVALVALAGRRRLDVIAANPTRRRGRRHGGTTQARRRRRRSRGERGSRAGTRGRRRARARANEWCQSRGSGAPRAVDNRTPRYAERRVEWSTEHSQRGARERARERE